MDAAPTSAERALALRQRLWRDTVSRTLESLQPTKIVAPLVLVQWGLTGLVAHAVGRQGSLPLVLLEVLVLLPAALALVYAAAARIAGPVFAAWTALVWVVLPYAGLAYATPSLRHHYTHEFLPHLLGLTGDGTLPALVAFLGAVAFALRALDTGTGGDAGAAVALAAAGSAFAPRAALVALAPVVMLGFGGRRRQALAAAGGLAVLLTVVGVADAAGALSSPFAHVGLAAPRGALGSLRENFWSGRVLEWLLIAGIAAAVRIRPAVGAGLAVAFLAAFLSIPHAGTPLAQNSGLLLALVPAWFAVVLLVSAVPFLWPRARIEAPASETLTRLRDRLRRPTFAPKDDAIVGERPVATPYWAAASIGFWFVVILFVGMWNATRAPVYVGYDAQAHIDYAYNLIHHGTLPGITSGSAYYAPPGYYLPAGIMLWIGQLIGTFEPPHLALYLNAFYTLATAILLLVLARLLFPRRPTLWVATVGFFAFLPIVARSTGMFYPEVLNFLVATAGLTLATWMLLRRRLGLRWLLLLGAVFAAGQMVRASYIFVVISIAAAFAGAIAVRRYREHMPLRTIALALGLVAVITSPWYIRQAVKYHAPPLVSVGGNVGRFLHPAGRVGYTPLPFWKLSKNDVLDRPVAPFYNNEALPMIYTEIWGDYFGYWAWANYSQGPSPDALPVLKAQSRLGILPTILAIAGWLALWGIAIRRRLDGLPIVPLLILPLLAVGAVVYRAYAMPTSEGDLLKASYALISVPAWAIGFGVAVDFLSRRRLVGLALAAVFLVSGILSLRFNLYGVRDHFVIF